MLILGAVTVWQDADDDVGMISRMIIQFVVWSRGDHVDALITRWSRGCFDHKVIMWITM